MKKLILALLFLNSTAYGATLLKARVTGTDGTPTYNEHATLAAAEAYNQKNLVTADQYLEIEISSPIADSTLALISGYTCDANRYIHIYTSGLARSTGSWDASKYVLSNTLQIGEEYVIVDGLQFTGTVSYAYYVTNSTAIIRNCQWNGSSINIAENAASGGVYHLYMYNCITRYTGSDNYNDRVRFDSNGLSVDYIYNCVFDAGGYNNSVVASSSATFKNCIVYNHGGSGRTDFSTTTGGAKFNTETSTDTICSDATGPSPEHNSISAATINSYFEDRANFDYHITDGSYPEGKGYNTTGDASPMNFTTDIDGDTYNTAAWDIGIDSLYAGEGGGGGTLGIYIGGGVILGGGVRIGQ